MIKVENAIDGKKGFTPIQITCSSGVPSECSNRAYLAIYQDNNAFAVFAADEDELIIFDASSGNIDYAGNYGDLPDNLVLTRPVNCSITFTE
ncbi:hypothetical protein [Vibrio phage JSF12]|uniref:Uncharacterized protein n=2 Tax=Jesfedecavirus TaxID=2560156 RepID=A0A2D0Z1L1_9CAUD|nr:hypothetical protein FDI98_gp049 [Vibrio phage JSF10]YP_009794781.1 hypothetical protein HOS35_gp098 [Vibrio phage JSF12]ASV43483.1 hypothetical protein [Vibrio phage JSF10]ASV43616.1 hypothetical protein [Vibrio phage JSF12]